MKFYKIDEKELKRADVFLADSCQKHLEATEIPAGAVPVTREEVQKVLEGYFSENENVPYALADLFGPESEASG